MRTLPELGWRSLKLFKVLICFARSCSLELQDLAMSVSSVFNLKTSSTLVVVSSRTASTPWVLTAERTSIIQIEIALVQQTFATHVTRLQRDYSSVWRASAKPGD